MIRLAKMLGGEVGIQARTILRRFAKSRPCFQERPRAMADGAMGHLAEARHNGHWMVPRLGKLNPTPYGVEYQAKIATLCQSRAQCACLAFIHQPRILLIQVFRSTEASEIPCESESESSFSRSLTIMTLIFTTAATGPWQQLLWRTASASAI